MNPAITAVLFGYGLVVGLWPLAWIVAIAREAFARRWPVVARMALLIPLWTVAVSIGGLQIPTMMAASATEASPRAVVAATAVAVALCVAVVGWMLLWRLATIAKPAGSGPADR